MSVQNHSIVLLIGIFLINYVSSECTYTRGESCYTFIQDPKTQADAQADCVENYNGNLVSVTSQAEDDFIRARYLDTFRNITEWVCMCLSKIQIFHQSRG